MMKYKHFIRCKVSTQIIQTKFSKIALSIILSMANELLHPVKLYINYVIPG